MVNSIVGTQLCEREYVFMLEICHPQIHVLAKSPTEIPETGLLLLCIFTSTFSTPIQAGGFASLSCGV